MSRRTASLLLTALLLGLGAIVSASSGAAESSKKDTSTLDRVFVSPDGEDAAGTAPPGQHGSSANHLPASRSNVELVGKLRLRGPFGDTAEGQIADVGVHKDHAYLASWAEPDCTRGGFFVADISSPATPREVTFVPALPDTYHGEGVHAISMNTASFSGDILAVNNEPCTEAGEGGFDLYDVSNPATPVPLTLAAGDRSPEGSLVQDPSEAANSAHSVFVWQDGSRAYAVAVDNTEQSDVDIFEITNPRDPVQIADIDLDATFPSIIDDSANGNSIFHHDMVVKEIGGVPTMLVSYWDAGYVQLNVEDPANPTLIQDTEFTAVDPETGLSPAEGNGHQAEFSHDNRFILAADEDFSSHRTDFRIATGPNAGPYASGEFGFSVPLATLPDKKLNGPTVFGGYGCPADDDIPPRASAGLRPLAADEDAILVVERGPVDDPAAPYPACRFDEKMQNAIEKGYDGIMIAQRHQNDAALDGAFCGSGEPRDIAGMCISHEAMHRIFDETPGYETPYTRPNPNEPDPGDLGADVEATATFDGWGYAHLYDRVTGREIDTYAIDESLDPRYVFGFGDLSIHEFATDPSANLAYSSYYSGGFRVVSFDEDGMEEVGHFIDEGGMNLWGVEQLTDDDGSRLIAVSDRDSGLYILRYTGPGAVGARSTGGQSSQPSQTPGPPTVVTTERLLTRRHARGLSLRSRGLLSRRSLSVRSTGRLSLPRGMSARQACNGRVELRIRQGTRTVSMRTARLRRDCTYSSRVVFRRPLRSSRALKIRAVFTGNDLLNRRRSGVATLRMRR